MEIEHQTVSSPRLPRATKHPWTSGNTPRRKATIFDGITQGRKSARVDRAIQLDNNGKWFLAYSKYPVALIEARFAQELVAKVLYERVGGILQGPNNYIYMQIVCRQESYSLIDGVVFKEVTDADKPDWSILLALREVGIYVDRQTSLEEIKASGLY